MTKKPNEKVTAKEVVASVEESFKKNIKPWWDEIEKHTIHIGRNSKIVYV